MGLKIDPTEGLTRELPILEDFKVVVPYKSRTDVEKLADRIRTLNADAQAEVVSAEYVLGWSGCTPSIVRRLGVNASDSNANGNGCIDFDPDTLRDMWRKIPAAAFSLPIMNFAHGLLDVIESEKQAQKKS